MAAILLGCSFGFAFVILCLVDDHPIDASEAALAFMDNPEHSWATFRS